MAIFRCWCANLALILKNSNVKHRWHSLRAMTCEPHQNIKCRTYLSRNFEILFSIKVRQNLSSYCSFNIQSLYLRQKIHFISFLSFSSAFKNVKLSLSDNDNAPVSHFIPISFNLQLQARPPTVFYDHRIPEA